MNFGIDLSIAGIKCDNEQCDYINENVSFEDYEAWLDKPCPKCGDNLLTKEDLDATRQLIEIAKLFDKKEESDDTVSLIFEAEMNGSGKINPHLKAFKFGK